MIEPFGFPQLDFHAALICQNVRNAAWRPEKPFQITDFMREHASHDDDA